MQNNYNLNDHLNTMRPLNGGTTSNPTGQGSLYSGSNNNSSSMPAAKTSNT